MISVPRYELCDVGKRIQAGDEFAFEGVFRQLYRPVYARAFAVLKNDQDAADTSQDVFIKVWQKASKWDPAGGPFLGWFLVLAERTIIDAYRKQKRSRKDTCSIEDIVASDDDSETCLLNLMECVSDGQPDPLRSIIADEAMQLIEEAVLSVSNRKHRLAWILRHFEGYPPRKISEIMGSPISSCKMWIHRCSKELRKELAKIDGQKYR